MTCRNSTSPVVVGGGGEIRIDRRRLCFTPLVREKCCAALVNICRWICRRIPSVRSGGHNIVIRVRAGGGADKTTGIKTYRERQQM